MATLEQLKTALVNAHNAGDADAAKVLAAEIVKMQSQSQKPERAGSSIGGTVHSLGTGIAKGTIALGNSLSEWPSRAEDWFAGKLGIEPEQMDSLRQARAGWGVGSPRTTADVMSKVEGATGEFYKPQGVAEDYADTLGQFIPGILMGPGKTTVAAIKNGVMPTLLGAFGSETAGQATKGSWMEPYARFVGGLSGGLLGGGVNNWASKPAAPIADVSAGAQARVGNALNDSFGGDVGKALARGDELGPDAMTLNLGRRPAQQASTIAAYPGVGSATIDIAVKKQLSGSGDRALADWESAIGPSISKYSNEMRAAGQKLGSSSLYEVAKGRVVDPAGVNAALIKELTEASNDPQARASLQEAAELLINPNSGMLQFAPKTNSPSVVGGSQAFINDAGALVNARIRISEMITKLGKEVSSTPGDNLFALGKRTATGARLNRIRKAINEVLHQDELLKTADKIWSTAEKTRNAFEFGRTKLLGQGDSVIESEALAGKMGNPKLTMEEKVAIAQGLSRKGKSILGDVRPNRNDGKAMGDAIATPNNLSRITQVSGSDAADKVGKMAAREDIFAKDAARITGQSATAERMAGQAEFPSPLLGGPQYAQIAQTSLLGAPLAAVTKLADMLTRGYISNNRSKLSADAAALLTKTGPERDAAVRSLMDYSAKLPKGHPLKTVIAQAVAPSLSSTVPALLGP